MAKETPFFIIIGTDTDSPMSFHADSSEELNFVVTDVFENLELGETIEVHDGDNEVKVIVRD